MEAVRVEWTVAQGAEARVRLVIGIALAGGIAVVTTAEIGVVAGIGVAVESLDSRRERVGIDADLRRQVADRGRSEEHTSELQSLMRISYAVFCLKKKN